MQKFTENSKLVLLLFVLLGLFIPYFANYLTWILFPAVIIISALTLNKARFQVIGKENIKIIFKMVSANYLLFGSLLIICALLFVSNTQFRLGLILLAISPPAIGIIPLSYHLSKYPEDASTAEFISYIAAMIGVPIVIAIISTANIFYVINLMLVMIILPFVLTQIFSMTKPKWMRHDNKITNILYGLLIYVLIGTNIESFRNVELLWPLFGIFIILTFLLGAGFYTFISSRSFKEEPDSLYIMFSTMKNGGFAGVLAFAFFSPVAAVPIAVFMLLSPYYIWFIETLLDKHHEHYRNSKHDHLKHAKLKKT